MKTVQPLFLKNIFVCLLLVTQSIHTQAQATSNGLEINTSGGSPWNQLLAGDKLLVNGQLLDPAGQSLDLTKGTRVLNLEFAHQKNLLIAKTNKHLFIIDTKGFKVINDFNYPETNEAGSMNGLAVDNDDSTIY